MSVVRHELMKPETNLLRELPSVDRVMTHPAAAPLLERFSRPFVAETLRDLIDELRQVIRSGHGLPPDRLQDESIITDLEKKLVRAARPGMVRVVNASGTILHTNLGRALLSEAAAEAVGLVARHPVNLEFDLHRGKRGQREAGIESLLRELTGAEAAAVVNNNAAAVLLGLNSMAEGKHVIVSRGELIEIGGSFRIPEVMAKSGALLREVGTTNRTHPRDYADAIDENTGLLLKVHTSNYRVVGFSAEVELKELVAIGRERGVPVMEDLGSGALVDLATLGLPREPLVAERVAMGADVVTFSGDKILGGPQAGLVDRRQVLDRPHEPATPSSAPCAATSSPWRPWRRPSGATSSPPTCSVKFRPCGPSAGPSTRSRMAAGRCCRCCKNGWGRTTSSSSWIPPARSAAAPSPPRRSRARASPSTAVKRAPTR